MHPALMALALGGFGIGLTEFVIMGLLPEVARDFRVTIPVAAYLISGYALGVVVGALMLTAAVTHLRRKPVLVSLLLLFIAGNLISAVAPSYGVMMTGRITASLCHGAFFGIGSVVAADLVAPSKRAGAIATMFAGLTLANVLGVPFGTLIGQHFGWRATFLAVTGIGVLALISLILLVPHLAKPQGASLRAELRAFRSGQVWLSLAMTALGFGGLFASFTYMAPLMTQVAGYPSSALTWLLVLFGGGLFVGNILGGKAADRALMPSLIGLLTALTIILGLFTWTAQTPILAALTLLALGTTGFATVPGLQMRVLSFAGEANTLASAANIAAFNLGNAAGAYLAGLAIVHGYGYTSVNWVGAGLSGLGLLVAITANALHGQSGSPSRSTQGDHT
ncbi:MFS transporter [Deinococcus sp. QL22]|uniref:MFS transporter n=1 Tax=Deinococcus sp. QL22 TaxID=2939437 RepID=UPI002018268A|nr:MFS transporter [Deinococcus sp. QL22]UQN07983.1 MFS transporter [Deinococcus sp. QL22]